MIINNASLEALRIGFSGAFKTGIAKVAPKYQLMTTTVSSTTLVQTYGFLGDFPVFREWLGEKRVRSLDEKAYNLTNKSFESTIGIHKDKIRDDNLGLYGPMVQGWGEEAGSLADRLAFEALDKGHVRVCFDGQNFFDAEHPVGEGVVSNMSGNDAVEAWYLLDCSKPLKPLLHQERQKPEFAMVTDVTDSHVFKTGEYLMGGEARSAVGYTYWQLAHRGTGTLNEANYTAACEAMAGITNDEGEPLSIRPTHIVVGRSNKSAARNLFKKANLAGGEFERLVRGRRHRRSRASGLIPMTDGIIRIKSSRQGYRRGGLDHGRDWAEIDTADLTAAQKRAVLGDPVLTIESREEDGSWSPLSAEIREGLAVLLDPASGIEGTESPSRWTRASSPRRTGTTPCWRRSRCTSRISKA